MGRILEHSMSVWRQSWMLTPKTSANLTSMMRRLYLVSSLDWKVVISWPNNYLKQSKSKMGICTLMFSQKFRLIVMEFFYYTKHKHVHDYYMEKTVKHLFGGHFLFLTWIYKLIQGIPCLNTNCGLSTICFSVASFLLVPGHLCFSSISKLLCYGFVAFIGHVQ